MSTPDSAVPDSVTVTRDLLTTETITRLHAQKYNPSTCLQILSEEREKHDKAQKSQDNARSFWEASLGEKLLRILGMIGALMLGVVLLGLAIGVLTFFVYGISQLLWSVFSGALFSELFGSGSGSGGGGGEGDAVAVGDAVANLTQALPAVVSVNVTEILHGVPGNGSCEWYTRQQPQMLGLPAADAADAVAGRGFDWGLALGIANLVGVVVVLGIQVVW
jgi:hypothetical protein